MGSDRRTSVVFPAPADAVFAAALGVEQNTKGARILAVHVGGRKLVARVKSMMSNPKFHHIAVEDRGGQAELFISVTTDPRGQKALLDGKANEKSMNNYVASVHAALAGTEPAPVTPVANHYLQKKDEVPWVDSEQAPDIILDGGFKAIYNL